MIYQNLADRVSVTANTTPGLIALPPEIQPGQIILLAVVGGYNADLEFASAASGAPKVPVFDDTGVTPVANNTFWVGPAREAPLYAFASGSTAIEVLIYIVREG